MWKQCKNAHNSAGWGLPLLVAAAETSSARVYCHTEQVTDCSTADPLNTKLCQPADVYTLGRWILAPVYLANDCRLLPDVGRRPLQSNSNDM